MTLGKGQKPKARGADRDSTPRALDRPRTDFADRLLPDLGPPRSAQHERPGWLEFAPTVDRDVHSRPLAQWGGRAVSRPDGRGFRFARQHKSASPGPVPRIAPNRHGVAAMPVPRWVRRVACRRSLTSRFDTPLAATLARPAIRGSPRISSGRPPERLLPPGASFDAVAGRRQPPCPHSLVASHGRVVGLRDREHFPISPAGFPSDDDRNIPRPAPSTALFASIALAQSTVSTNTRRQRKFDGA